MLRKCIKIIVFLSIFIYGSSAIYAASPLEDDKCWNEYNQKILNDIKKSYPELAVLNKEGKVTEYVFDDLHKVITIEGRESPHIKSLQPLFMGGSLGERKLFIVSGEETLPPKYDNSFVGYLLYKDDTDGSNIMIKLRRSDTSWDVVSESKKSGKMIKINCKN